MFRPFALACTLAILACGAWDASAQNATRPAPAAPAGGIHLGGYGLFGQMRLTAVETFDAILGTRSGPIVGGGATVGLPLGGLYVDVGAWRFKQDGQRVFVSGSRIVPLGIPLTMTLTPIEVTVGWQFRRGRSRLVPYAGGGFTSYRYEESSTFAGAGEDVSERFSGYHLVGGAQFKILTWLGVGGEVVWTTLPDSLGTGGVSKAFGDTNLGGTSLRAKVTVGR